MTQPSSRIERLPLMAKDVVANPKRSCPQVAMVSVDGGRLQIRSEPSEPKQDSHWRESKVAVLETYQSDVHQADPDPDVPRCFLDLKRTKEMVRGLGHALPVGLEFEVENQDREAGRGGGKRGVSASPVRAVPSVWSVASWPAASAPTNSARWCIRRPGSGTSSERGDRLSWETACR